MAKVIKCVSQYLYKKRIGMKKCSYLYKIIILYLYIFHCFLPSSATIYDVLPTKTIAFKQWAACASDLNTFLNRFFPSLSTEFRTSQSCETVTRFKSGFSTYYRIYYIISVHFNFLRIFFRVLLHHIYMDCINRSNKK